MEEHTGWGASGPPCEEAVTGHWQGNWDGSRDDIEWSEWGTSNWNQPGNDVNSLYDEFENVMQWDDSGAQLGFESARKLDEEHLKGVVLSVSLPSPDLYIQAIDWDSHEDLKIPEPSGAFSPPRKCQRKRGRRASVGLRGRFDREETSQAADRHQRSKPFLQMAKVGEVHAERGKEFTDPRGLPWLQETTDAKPRVALSSHLQSNRQDQSRNFCSSFHGKQSSDWSGHGQSSWDQAQNRPFPSSRQRWIPTNNLAYQPKLGHGRSPNWSSHALPKASYCQASPTAHGNGWMPQQEAHGQSLVDQSPLFKFSSCSSQHARGHYPYKTY